MIHGSKGKKEGLFTFYLIFPASTQPRVAKSVPELNLEINAWGLNFIFCWQLPREWKKSALLVAHLLLYLILKKKKYQHHPKSHDSAAFGCKKHIPFVNSLFLPWLKFIQKETGARRLGDFNMCSILFCVNWDEWWESFDPRRRVEFVPISELECWVTLYTT